MRACVFPSTSSFLLKQSSSDPPLFCEIFSEGRRFLYVCLSFPLLFPTSTSRQCVFFYFTSSLSPLVSVFVSVFDILRSFADFPMATQIALWWLLAGDDKSWKNMFSLLDLRPIPPPPLPPPRLPFFATYFLKILHSRFWYNMKEDFL